VTAPGRPLRTQRDGDDRWPAAPGDGPDSRARAITTPTSAASSSAVGVPRTTLSTGSSSPIPGNLRGDAWAGVAGCAAVDIPSDLFGTILDNLLGAQPAPPALLVVATAAAALLVVAVRPVWRLARNGITIAHEGGHALVAVLAGRRLSGIRLHSDTSGLTVTRGRASGPGMVFTLLAGYVTPSLLGLAGAWALATGRITLLLWSFLLLLAAMLINIRNLYGLLAVLVAGGAVFAVSWYTAPEVHAAFAYAVVWFLLIGGVRPVAELQSLRRRRRAGDSDADQLARLTLVPGLVWVGFFGLVNLAALGYAGYLLLWPAVSALTG
jgi:hypothetical protein